MVAAPRSSPIPAWARFALGFVAIALGLAAVVSRASSFGWQDVVRNEFTQDYVSARAISDGLDPYAPERALMERYLPGRPAYVVRNPHPPLQILLVWPFSRLPFRGARAIWLLVQAAAIASAIALIGRELGWSRSIAAVVGIGALAVPVAQKELVYGNLNGLMLLLLAVAWRALRAERESAAGAAVGAATALKLFPLFMLIPLIRMRRTKGAGVAVASGAILTVVGFIPVGFSSIHGLRASLAENAAFWRAAPFNVSLVAIPYRWLDTTIWHTGVATAPRAAGAIAGLLIAGCLMSAYVTPAYRSRDVFWAAAPWMVLMSPLAWDWYLVLTLPIVVLIISHAVEDRQPPGVLALVAIAIVLVGAPPGLPAPGQPISFVALVLGYGLATYGLVLLGVADFTRRSRAAQDSPAQASQAAP